MKNTDSREELVRLKYVIFASLISADNNEYTEEVKQEILHRYNTYREFNPYADLNFDADWDYILEPLKEDKEKYMKVLGS